MGPAAWTHLAHTIKVEQNSKLAGILKPETELVSVNSLHHQAILEQSIPANSDLVVSARSPDGIVEAIERKNYPAFFIGVQCHIETLVAETGPVAELWNKVFHEFICQAKKN